jgi:transcriptional regulator with XRE-family HTH domain
MGTLGKRLDELIKRQKMSYSEVGRKVGATPQTIINLVNGFTKNPSSKLLDELSNLFNVRPEWLLKGDEENVSMFEEKAAVYGDEDSQIIRALKNQVDKLEERLIYYKAENYFLRERLDKFDNIVVEKLKEAKEESNRKTG